MKDWLREEINSCDDCLRLKSRGVIPPICQEHLDKQILEKAEDD